MSKKGETSNIIAAVFTIATISLTAVFEKQISHFLTPDKPASQVAPVIVPAQPIMLSVKKANIACRRVCKALKGEKCTRLCRKEVNAVKNR